MCKINLDFDAEIAAIGMTKEYEASLVASTLLSVVRDQAISSFYGKRLSEQQGVGTILIESVFTSDYAEHLKNVLSTYCIKQEYDFPLYSGEGDAIGQLSRLLIPCHEKSEWFKEYVDNANDSIDRLRMDKYMSDADYIRHIRNAVLHCRFKVFVDKEDFNKSKIVFLDIIPGNRITAKIIATSENMVDIFKILVNVYKKYLNDIGWIIY
jgi:hypothetical protein